MKFYFFPFHVASNTENRHWTPELLCSLNLAMAVVVPLSLLVAQTEKFRFKKGFKMKKCSPMLLGNAVLAKVVI